MTKHMLGPLEIGDDGRGYTPSSVRTRLNTDIEKTTTQHQKLEDILPPVAMTLRKEAQKTGATSSRLSTRKRSDKHVKGDDYTLTRIDGTNRGGNRTPADTPQPQSPRPEEHGESLVADSRYERAHQNPFQFTGQPGNTVWAPTQANQVVDTHMERFVSGSSEGYLLRHDTYTHSSLTAVRATPTGFESRQASYQRRPTAASGDGDAKRKRGDSAPPAPSTPTTGAAPPDGNKKRKT
jgi:hypothetical protein